jgi:TRAP-type C4-dicarboxylate transport system permease small subunit
MFRKYENFVKTISNWFGNIGAAMLLGISIITFLDIFGSKFFALPFPGSVELTGFLQTMLIPFAAAITLIAGQHIKVDLFTEWLPAAGKVIVDGIVSFILFCLSIVIVWQSIVFGISVQSSGEYSGTLHIPSFFVIYFMSLGFACLALAFLQGFLKLFGGHSK